MSAPSPITPPHITVAEVVAIVAMVDGKASAEQAKLGIDWIMREAARIPDLSFRLGGEDGRRATDFAEGRRYVGHLIRQMLQPETLKAVRESEAKAKRQP